MTIGSQPAVPALDRPDLLAPPVATALEKLAAGQFSVDGIGVDGIGVAEIDPALADTAAFCEQYGVALSESANCVVVEGRRAGESRMAACMILATTRADVNGLVRRELDVRKCSFAAMDTAVELTSMEYGGITPIGLPPDWPIFVDAAVAQAERVVIGSGIRGSKLTLPGAALASLPGAKVLDGLGR